MTFCHFLYKNRIYRNKTMIRMIIDDKSRAIVIMWNNIKPQRGTKPQTVNRPRCRFSYQRTRAFLLLSPACVAFYQPYYLDVARYAHGNKTANLLNNQTKSGTEFIDRFGLNSVLFLSLVFCLVYLTWTRKNITIDLFFKCHTCIYNRFHYKKLYHV